MLMLLPLSAFEATAALPGAAVQLTRSRIAARRLHGADEPKQRRLATPCRPLGRPASRAPGSPSSGPAARGKTTLLMQTSPALLPEDDRFPHAVFFAEDAHLFSTTVRDNLSGGPRRRDRRRAA